jgi:peptidyl-prolyl cis-trans isomerase D
MAVISTIRNRFGWLLIGFMILVLFLFVISSEVKNMSALFGGQNNKSVGSIAGNSISTEEFQAEMQATEQEMFGGQPVNEQQRVQIREVAWNRLFEKYSIDKEIRKLGLTVTDDELVDIVQGNNIDPTIQQYFVNPLTKQFDKQQVVQFLKTRLDSLPIDQKRQWVRFEESLRKKRLREKYDNLFKLSAYVTKAEAQREYENQTAKADIKYLFVPYFSIPDSTVKVTDDQLKDYYNKNKEKYKSVESRTIQYVSFQIMPSREDSAYFLEEIKKSAKELAIAENDSLYAMSRSDVPFPYTYQAAYELPAYLQEDVKSFIKGGINGPYKEGSVYSIYKLVDTKEDTVTSFKISHILLRDTTQDGNDKAIEILNRLKKGENFEELARQFSTDQNSAVRGGDLGWYTKGGGFVKPFEDAVYKFGRVGLIDKLVKTEHGYHIIKITDGPNRTKYKIAGVQRNIASTDATREAIYAKASKLAADSKDIEAFREAVKKDPTLQLLSADRVSPNSDNLNTLSDAREIVRWANDAKVGEVRQEPFSIGDQFFVVAALAGKTEKNNDDWQNFKEQLTYEVRKQLKGEQILAKLNGKTGTLEDIAKGFGVTAQIGNAPEISLGSPSLGALGSDPVAGGKAFGLKEGQRSKPFAGENGVIIVETTRLVAAPEIADYTQYKNQLKQMQNFIPRLAEEALREAAKIDDKRYRVY